MVGPLPPTGSSDGGRPPLPPGENGPHARAVTAPPRPVGEVEVHVASVRARRILAAGYCGHVVGSHRHGIVALDRRGRPLHLTSRADAMGPFSLWIGSRSWPTAWRSGEPPASTRLTGGAGALYLGGQRITLDRAANWEPRPPWRALCGRIPFWIDIAKDLGADGAGEGPDLSCDRSWSWLQARRSEFRRALRRRDGESIGRTAWTLAGLGPGLTPAGDDYLAGVLLGLRAIPSSHLWLLAAPAVLTAVPGRTSALSTALLAAAFRGEAARPWHELAGALARSDARRATAAAARVRRLGHSSGRWTLIGFLDTVLDATEGAGTSPPPP